MHLNGLAIAFSIESQYNCSSFTPTMPELDPTSPYAHLAQLAREYLEIIERAEDTSLTSEERQILSSERTVLHDQVIEELRRLGQPKEDREAAMKFAIMVAKWVHPAEDDYDV